MTQQYFYLQVKMNEYQRLGPVGFATNPFTVTGSPLKPDDLHGKLKAKYYEKNMFSKPLIEMYDRWVDEQLPEYLSTPFVFSDGTSIFIEDYSLTPPNKTPKQCRETSSTYFIEIKGRLCVTSQGITTKSKDLVYIADIPLMLGSKHCMIGKEKAKGLGWEESLYAKGEDPLDPFGYFIVNGTERVVIIQEKLRINKFINITESMSDIKKDKGIITDKTPNIVCKLTYDSHYGTRIFDIRLDSLGSINTYFSFFGKKAAKNVTVPSLLLFRHKSLYKIDENQVAMPMNIDEIMELILKYVPDKYRNLIMVFLAKARYDYNGNGDIYKYLIDKSDPSTADLGLDFNMERFFFPQCPDHNSKVEMYAFAISRYCQTLTGVIMPDDRDIWANKRIEFGPRSMELLFMSLWSEVLKVSQNKIRDTGSLPINDLAIIIEKRKIKEVFSSSLASVKWGNIASSSSSGMNELVDAKSIVNLYSLMTKVSVKTSDMTKLVNIRTVQGDQLGFICPATTPEGSLCGISKHLANTCKSSLERNKQLVLNHVKLSSVMTDTESSPFMLNGMLHGWCDGLKVRNHLVQLRRNGSIHPDISIVLESFDFMNERNQDYKQKCLYVYCDVGRPIRPLLIYNYDSKRGGYGPDMVQDLTDVVNRMSFEEMLVNGYIEYIDPFESHYAYIASSFDDVRDRRRVYEDALAKGVIENAVTKNVIDSARRRLKLTHVELDPEALFGYAAATNPMPERNQGPRVGWQAGMTKQALEMEKGLGRDAKYTSIAGESPNFITNMHKFLNIDQIGGGRNMTVAIMPYYGYNQEDAIIVGQHVVDKLHFAYDKNIEKVVDIKLDEIMINDIDPQKNTPYIDARVRNSCMKNPYYRHISKAGFAKIGSIVKKDDILVAKFTKTGHDTSIRASIDDEGRIVSVTANDRKVTIKIAKFYNIKVGDKMALRYSQKGVIGLILKSIDMPVTMNGKIIDMIINPHSLPSRMTVGMLVEFLTGNYTAMVGERMNATAFRKFEPAEFMERMKLAGFNQFGHEDLINGTNGAILKNIMVGIVYYQSLPHMVASKIQMRSTGAVDARTRQVIGGRGRGGGIRLGEMESDALISHGAIHVVLDRLVYSSDRYEQAVCRTCSREAFFINGKYKCLDETCARENTNVGRLVVPYSFKRFTEVIRMGGIKSNIAYIETEKIRRHEAEMERMVRYNNLIGKRGPIKEEDIDLVEEFGGFASMVGVKYEDLKEYIAKGEKILEGFGNDEDENPDILGEDEEVPEVDDANDKDKVKIDDEEHV
jgi:DNA-directed RNA polymerase subunit B